MDFKNKVVIVTGASRGLGAAIAEALAEVGAHVTICSRNIAAVNAECQKIIGNRGSCKGYEVDVTKQQQVNKFVKEVLKAHGKIDVLVNNAGYADVKKPLEEVSYEEYKLYTQTNFDSVFYFMKAVLPQMKKQNSGLIVNIASGAGRKGHPGLAVYSATKFAVLGLTESVAKELEGTGVKCIALCPGGINTAMRAAIFGKEDAEKQQSPFAVAEILRDMLLGKIKVPNGADVHIRNGQITVINDNLAK